MSNIKQKIENILTCMIMEISILHNIKPDKSEIKILEKYSEPLKNILE